MSALKRPRRVLSPAETAAYDLVAQNVAPDPAYSPAEVAARDQQPSNQVLNMLREMADWALDHDPEQELDWPDLIHGLLVKLDYIPPRDLPDRWKTLLNRLSDYARWGEAGPNWDEKDLTESGWERAIRDELVGIAGRPM